MKTAGNEAFDWDAREENVDQGNPVQDILLEYSQANATQRLHLWLSYRDLRREFDAVADMWREAPGKGGMGSERGKKVGVRAASR